MSQLYDLYQATDKANFSQKVCEIAPYFSTISPLFRELKPGYAEVWMPNTREVHNHLGTVHAIAMCNLAEISGGIMTDVSIPENFRWIPTGMEVQYLARATTDIVGIADGSAIDWQTEGDKRVPVNITDEQGTTVCKAVIIVRIGLKKQ